MAFDKLRPNGLGDLGESLDELASKLPEIPLHAAGTADQDMVGARHPALGQQLPRKRAQAPLHAVANDGAADLPGDGIADPDGGIAVRPVADQQDEAGHGRAPAAIRGQEVGAAAEGG